MAIHSEIDGTLVGESLKDGIIFEQTPNWLKFACPKGKPKVRGLKEVKDSNGVLCAYEVPKSDVYFQATHRLADGSTVMLLRYKQIPQEEREEFYAAAVAAHKSGALLVPIKPLSEGKASRAVKPKITFESLQ